jgi:tetratricopeptide (TPR) repeat protein
MKSVVTTRMPTAFLATFCLLLLSQICLADATGPSLRLFIEPSQTVVAGPVTVTAVLKNEGQNDLLIAADILPYELTYRVLDENGRDIPAGDWSIEYWHDEIEYCVLKPGQYLVWQVSLLGICPSLDKPGAYRISASLDWKNPPTAQKDAWQGVISSDEISFIITEPEGADAKAFSEAILPLKARGVEFGMVFSVNNASAVRDIAEKYPASVYAMYARYALAGFAQDRYKRGKEIKDYEEALKQYEAIVAVNSDSPIADDAEYQIALLYEMAGRHEDALAAAKKVTETYPDSDSAYSAWQFIQGKPEVVTPPPPREGEANSEEKTKEGGEDHQNGAGQGVSGETPPVAKASPFPWLIVIAAAALAGGAIATFLLTRARKTAK